MRFMAKAISGFRPLATAAAFSASRGRGETPIRVLLAEPVSGTRGDRFWSAIWPLLRTHLTRPKKPSPEARSPGKASLHAAVIACSFLIVGVLHRTIPHASVFWHNFFQWLYYGLAAIAAARFGLRGGLLAAGAALAGYIPHLTAPETPVAFANYSAQLIALFLTSVVIGILADRERSRREQMKTALHDLGQAHRDLQAGVEQLRRADRLSAVGQLAASLAHEIRNPLASIQSAVTALDYSGAADETRRELRQIIAKECGRLQHLLTGMLDFARPCAAEYRIVDVTQTFNSVTALVEHAAAKNGITLRKDLAPGVTFLECDPGQLTQVILNLTLNAIQAMPAGGEIVLSARRHRSNLVVQVRDQGIGIDAGNLDRIFDPFFTTKENGTGLGLAVAHRIVNDHGGGIKAEKNADKGMTFSVTLPLGRPESVCSAELDASGTPEPSEEVWDGRRHSRQSRCAQSEQVESPSGNASRRSGSHAFIETSRE